MTRFKNIVLYHKREIAQFIYAQLQQHFFLESGAYEEPEYIHSPKSNHHNFSKYTADKIHHFTETITPTNMVSTKVLVVLRKLVNLYKFDSKSEKDFAILLESDHDVIRWLRPAMSHFVVLEKKFPTIYT